MSSEKRRRARVQGGWAAPNPKAEAAAARGRDANSEKPHTMPAPPAWLAKNSSDPAAPEKKFVFEEPNEELKKKPKERIIEDTGVYDLGKTTNGVSRIRLFNKFIESFQCEKIMDRLMHELPWKQRTDRKNGVEFLQPRMTAWFGDHPYSYSGLTHPASKEWPTILQDLKERLEENTGLSFNSMLANLYRDGHDMVAWHADDEDSLGPHPTIASLSFGDTRNFELRQKLPKGTDEGEYEYVERVKIPLTAGSLLIMEGATQEDWQHRLPREYHDRGPRINLTYRVIFPPE